MLEQEQKTPNKAKQIIFVLIALIIGIALGFAGGRYGGCYSKSEISGVKTAADCEARLEKAKKAFPVIPEMMSVFGNIKEINDKAIVLESTNFSPFEDLPIIRRITVKDGAKIVKFEQKDQAVYQKEMADYQKAISEQPDKIQAVTPPLPFMEKTISFLDLKIGDQIVAEAGENIKTKAEFAATKIILQMASPINAGD